MTSVLAILEHRFLANMHRHEGLDWSEVLWKFEDNAEALGILERMEDSGGEPDVILLDDGKKLAFLDCALESPKGRRSLCYDRQALEERKEHKPKDNALDVAKAIGIELLNEAEYRRLQEFGPFDTTTSSWVLTPSAIRAAGGALFCDHRYGHTFTYHNGAGSYYAARGFRGKLVL